MRVARAAAALPVRAQQAHLLGQLAVVGQHRAAIAIGAERLRRIEAGGRRVALSARGLAAPAGTEALRRILQHEQPVRPRDLPERLIVRRTAEEIDHDHRARPELARPSERLDRAAQTGRSEIAALRLDVDEHRGRPRQRDRLGARGEGEARHEDRIAGPDAARHQDQEQRIGAARAGDRMTDPDTTGEGLLQLSDLGAHDELAVREDRGDRRLDPAAETAPLGLQIDERQRRWRCRGQRSSPWLLTG